MARNRQSAAMATAGFRTCLAGPVRGQPHPSSARRALVTGVGPARRAGRGPPSAAAALGTPGRPRPRPPARDCETNSVPLMTSRQRLLAALDRKLPDRLPVTTHHLMPWFLEHRMGGISEREFFDRFGLDAILWTTPLRPDEGGLGHEARRSHDEGAGQVDRWRVEHEIVPDPDYATTR